MEMNGEIAEFYGALLGDGCLSKYKTTYENRTRFAVKFTGHTHDRKYFEETLQPTIIKTFGIKGYVQDRPKYNATTFDIISKSAFNYFHKLGMPIGKKQEFIIPETITNNPKFAIACIRGIFNTDGSIYRRYSKKYNKHTKIYEQMIIQFKMNSKNLLKQIKLFLDFQSIKTNKLIKSENAFVLRITEQDSLHKFMTLINTTHSHHRERYLNRCESTQLR